MTTYTSNSFSTSMTPAAGLPGWRAGMTLGEVKNIGTLDIFTVLQAGGGDPSQDYGGYCYSPYIGTNGSLVSCFAGGHAGNTVSAFFAMDSVNAAMSRIGTGPLPAALTYAAGSETILGGSIQAGDSYQSFAYRYKFSSPDTSLYGQGDYGRWVTYGEHNAGWPAVAHRYGEQCVVPPGILGTGSKGGIVLPMANSLGGNGSGVRSFYAHVVDSVTGAATRMAEIPPPTYCASTLYSGSGLTSDDYKWVGSNQPSNGYAGYDSIDKKLYFMSYFDSTNRAIAVLDCSGSAAAATWNVLPGETTTRATWPVGADILNYNGYKVWVELRSNGTIWYANVDHAYTTKHTWVQATTSGLSLPNIEGSSALQGTFRFIRSKGTIMAWTPAATGWGNYVYLITPPASLGGNWVVSRVALSTALRTYTAGDGPADGPHDKMWWSDACDAAVYAPDMRGSLVGIRLF